MKFLNMFELETVIDNIVNQVPCSKCGTHLTPQDLSVVGSQPHKCLVAGQCAQCGCPMAITVNIARNSQAMEGEVRVPESVLPNVDSITEKPSYVTQEASEYEKAAQASKELSKQLEGFDGDFNTLFADL